MQDIALRIPITDSTPRIEFNPATNVYIIDGWSMPFDGYTFYEPVLNWLKRNEKSILSCTFEIRLYYFNTPTAKMLVSLFELLESFINKGKNIKVKWVYVDDDDKEDIMETFSEDVNVPFEFEQIKEDEVTFKKHIKKTIINQYGHLYDELFVSKCTKILNCVLWNSIHGRKERVSGVDTVYDFLNREIPKDEIGYILNLFYQAPGTFLSKEYDELNGHGFVLNLTKDSNTFNKDLQNTYKIYQNLREDTLCFGYQGEFSDDMTEKIVALSEYSINNKEDAKKLRKKVSFLMAESFQNIIRHTSKAGTKNRAANRMGMFLARSVASNYYIVSSNLVENKFIESIRSKLEKANSLTADELKALYMEILSYGELSSKGGAGLGFIEMARKSGQKLDFEFEKVNDQFSLFYLGIKLKGTGDDAVKEMGIPVSLGFAKDFHHQVNEGNILMIYKGDFARESILPLLKVIEENMERNIEEFKVKKKVFLVLIELLQNISKHAFLVNGIRDGIFIFGKKDHYYQITVGNLVETSSVHLLETKLKNINTLDSKKLAILYKTTLMEGGVSEKGGAGVGLIDIARGSSDKMDYSFIPYNDNLTFYLLSVRV